MIDTRELVAVLFQYKWSTTFRPTKKCLRYFESFKQNKKVTNRKKQKEGKKKKPQPNLILLSRDLYD